MENQQLLREGTILNNGKYRIIRHIASGGFGNTYEVENTSLKTLRLAMKEFFIKGDTHREADSLSVSVSNSVKKELFSKSLAKFKTEAERLCQLRNEHIVGIHDFFEENGTAYYVMEYIEGKSLSQILKEAGRPMAEPQALSVLNQMLDALESIHSRQIWHMDIKPGNILMDAYGKCTLIDFGASKQTDVEGMVTASTSLAYTPGYAPPEQVGGNKDKWGPWTDIFALGSTVYNLLTGNRPPNHDDVIDRGMDAYVYPAGVSGNTRLVLKKMMELSPMRRPQSVDEVRMLLNGQAVNTPSASVPFQDNDVTVVTPQNATNPLGRAAAVPPAGRAAVPAYQHSQAGANPARKSQKGIIITLCAILFLLLAGLAVMMIKNCQDQNDVERKLAEMTAQQEQEKKQLEEKQAQVEAEKARLAEAEQQRLEDEKRQEAARRKAAEAEAARQRAEAQAEVVNYNSATGVYTGVICGVKARMNIRQSGSSISGTYTGNTRNYKVTGTVDDYLNFDLNVGGGAIVNGQIDGRVMSGMWEELGSGKYYSFSLSR